MKEGRTAFESLYDTYSPLLYGIALNVSPTEEEAERVLIETFEEIYNQKAFARDHSSLSLKLIRIAVRIAHSRFNPDRIQNFFKFPCFENAPLLHHLICEQRGIGEFCDGQGITRGEAMKLLHDEYTLIRHSKKASNG